jgi:predicted Rossmann fold nucleotide-binding protein DprA/Smf involved in DNA uptake
MVSSDAALVVSSGEEAGGTWAGATEAIKAGRVQVYVRITGTEPPGNRRLVQAGALPFPAEAWAHLGALLRPPAPKAEPPPPPDAYTLILPELIKALQAQQSDKALAERFGVRLPQMKDWLSRALEEGRVKKTKKPKAGYVVHDVHSELMKPETLPLFKDFGS